MSLPSQIFDMAFACAGTAYSDDACGPRTINSPITPTGNSFASSKQAIGLSLIWMTCQWIELNLRPTQTPLPASVRAAVSVMISVASIVEMGKHSVAPYGVCISASTAAHAKVFRITPAGTGAPHENIFFSSGIRSSVRAQCPLTTDQTAGEAKACVTFQSLAASISFAGLAFAGREKSISGNTV